MSSSADDLTSQKDLPAEQEGDVPWRCRWALLLVGLSPLAPQIVGSIYNIAYNVIHVEPLLKVGQSQLLHRWILISNLAVYPVAVAVWAWSVLSIRNAFRRCLSNEPRPTRLDRARRRAVNLTWWAFGVGAAAWLACIPGILLPLHYSSEPVDWRVNMHMTTSIVLGALIGVTQAFFAVELTSQYCLFPVMFQDRSPSGLPGTFTLSLRGRGIMWVVSAIVCPVMALLLLTLTPHENPTQGGWFAIFVAATAIGLGLVTAVLVSELVSKPLREIRGATREVARGNFDVRIESLRADEFGPVIDEFNKMVGQLREKQQLQSAFGRHVGREAARQILRQDPNLQGAEREVTVLFADLRDFTARCAESEVQEVVRVLNLYFTEMVDVIEGRHDGMVNKFLGDGLMALFGVGDSNRKHADSALHAAVEMFSQLDILNAQFATMEQPPLKMGIGIHTGPAIVGSIGSSGRGDYTAIGSTVNLAARVEALTKTVGAPILLTAATHQQLTSADTIEAFPAQLVKGWSEPLAIYGIHDPTLAQLATYSNTRFTGRDAHEK